MYLLEVDKMDDWYQVLHILNHIITDFGQAEVLAVKI